MPESCKKSFHSAKIILAKMRFCNECNDKRLCDKCSNQVNANKKFEANFHLLKRQPPKQFGYMLPYFKE